MFASVQEQWPTQSRLMRMHGEHFARHFSGGSCWLCYTLHRRCRFCLLFGLFAVSIFFVCARSLQPNTRPIRLTNYLFFENQMRNEFLCGRKRAETTRNKSPPEIGAGSIKIEGNWRSEQSWPAHMHNVSHCFRSCPGPCSKQATIPEFPPCIVDQVEIYCTMHNCLGSRARPQTTNG